MAGPRKISSRLTVSRVRHDPQLSQGLGIPYGKWRHASFDIGNSVTAQFADGSTVAGSMLIGCEGAREETRECVAGSEAAKGFESDYTMMNAGSRLPAPTALALRGENPMVSRAIPSQAFKQGDVVQVDSGWSLGSRADLKRNNRDGRITLAGGAAHSTVPQPKPRI
ncbi:uncharacterized protein PV09_03283 [Verruconis gallopava]|uniref:Uncharacterized protein n=1 Tax=Verruconis gallopava TaxID=253628 RepID=A0A0D1XTP0_9PEZI|nr:uncharacterized protein PV09_03283 [Verruconis gallopava]KIW06116.1 hypothetical protein PV09_03283 [Verruconis gallopava]